MEDLRDKISFAQLLIKWVSRKYKKDNVAVAWSGGKDSTVLLHIIVSLYNNKVPFKVFFADSNLDSPGVSDFIKKVSRLWSLKLNREIVVDKKGADLISKEKSKEKIYIKIEEAFSKSLLKTIKKEKIKVMFWGTLFHDHNNRQKDFFSKKHGALFVFPLLHFEEKDIWRYIYENKVPYMDLYLKGYRGLGIGLLTKKASIFNKAAAFFIHRIMSSKFKPKK